MSEKQMDSITHGGKILYKLSSKFVSEMQDKYYTNIKDTTIAHPYLPDYIIK